jgi:hypothetical protein
LTTKKENEEAKTANPDGREIHVDEINGMTVRIAKALQEKGEPNQ